LASLSDFKLSLPLDQNEGLMDYFLHLHDIRTHFLRPGEVGTIRQKTVGCTITCHLAALVTLDLAFTCSAVRGA
jgi:hypothetical protein